MCGISGIIDQQNNVVNINEIEKINDLIAHRGPDDEGFFIEKNFAFGHRRLSIIDLSSDGHQPMQYMNRYTITYNGEIYNYPEIREELKKNGYIFKSRTDTEVILASYDKWGEKCVEKFNGMWAFAIYDKQKEIIFCSRDRFGIKPFYYTEVDNKFIFGSEIKQLLHFYQDRFVNTTILSDYLLYGLEEHTNETFFKNIYKLEQSHNLIYDLKKHVFTIKRYFDIKIDKTVDKLNEKQSIDFLSRKLENAVDLRLRSDVKVGTCLSGGLDSSSIAAIASEKYYKQTGNKFTAIHAKSIEKKTDESFYAKEVAKHCNLEYIEVEPKLEDISDFVQEVVYTQEEPFGGPSIFMQYFVMKTAKENGCKVMLDGQGGDETLFGYESYYAVYFASLIRRYRFFEYFKNIMKLPTFKLSKKMVMRNSILILFRNKISKIDQFFRKKRTNIKIQHNRKRLDDIFDFLEFKSFQKREIMIRNLPHLLRYEDKNSMRNSVETRLPFVDYLFVEGALSINDKLKFKNGYLKYLLRRIVENILPKGIVWRTNKFGFEAPTDMWIEKNRELMIKSIKSSKILKEIIDFSDENFNQYGLLWRFYNISVWEKCFGVKIEK